MSISIEMTLQGVLLAGKWRNEAELKTMSDGDCRNTLIVELSGHSKRDPENSYQQFDNDELIGKGAIVVFLSQAMRRSRDELQTMSDFDQRNGIILENHNYTGIPVGELQRMSNQKLARLACEWSVTAGATLRPLADPYVTIQTVIPETKDQDLSYLTISEAEDPERDLELIDESESDAVSIEMTLRGVLLAGKWKNEAELGTMTDEDCRNSLIVVLSKHCKGDPQKSYQRFNNNELIGKAAIMLYLMKKGVYNEDQLSSKSDDDQRNAIIVENYKYTGIPVGDLQGMSNQKLARLACEWSAASPPDMTSMGKTRIVHVSGVRLVWDSNEHASTAMMAYRNQTDIGELNLYADTVLIREPIVVPGGDVRIYARRVEFQGHGRIVTEPNFVQQTPVEIGRLGPRGACGGSVSLLIKPPGGETWPASMAEFASGLYIDKACPDGKPLISTKGGKGQKGADGAATQTPHGFGSAESKGKSWLLERLAESPVKNLDGTNYGLDGNTVTIGTFTSDVYHPGWSANLPSLGGGNILRVILQPMLWGSTGYLPLADWHSDPKHWPPRNGGDATPAAKPGVGGKGGDVVSTVNIAVNRKTKGTIQLNDCVELAGGKSGDVGKVAKGGDSDSPNPYRIQTATVVIDAWDGTFRSMAVNRVDSSNQTITLSKGKDATPLRPARESGDNGTLRNADHPASWLHPFQVRAVIQYAKDLFLNGHRDKSYALLSAYREALRPTDEVAGWPAELQLWRDELHELAAEVNMLLQRLEDSLDFFGNPVGWAPVLSLKSNLLIYDAEIDDAIKQLWYAYRVRTAFDRVQDATKDLQDAVGALNGSRKNLEGTLTQAQNSVPGLLTSLQNKQTSYADRASKLKQRRDKLLGDAKDNEARQRTIKAVFGVIDAACSIIPVGQPYLKAAGSALNNVSQFFTEDPDDRSKALDGLAKTAGAMKDDLGTYNPSLTRSVSDELDKVETQSAEVATLIEEREASLGHVEAKIGSYKEIRTAKAAASAKELAIEKIEGDINGLNNQIQICTRNRPPVPKPPQKDTDDDKERRKMLDQIVSEAKAKLPDQQAALDKAKGELPGLKEAFADKTAALARSEDRYDWSASARSAKATIASKKRKLTQKKAEQSADIQKWQRALGNASEGLGKLANSVKQFTLPADQVAARVNAELVKLEKDDPLYTELKETVDDLDLEVTELKESLQSTKSLVDTTTRNWLDNRRQTRSLSATIQSKSRVLDHFALQYVDKMRADAYERLVRYQYYIQKSFEYLFLTPCPYVDYRLTQMNDRVLELLETSAGQPLAQSDFDLMKTLFRRPMIRIAQHIVDLMQSKTASRAAKIPVNLASHLIPALNAGRTARCSLVDAFGLPLSNANQRIDSIELVKVELASSDGPQAESLRIYIRHLGPSIVRGMDKLYWFHAGRPGGRSHWGFTWEVAGKTASTDPRTRETTDILALILGLQQVSSKPDQMVSDLSEYFPGIFSDFEFSAEWVGEGAKPAIRALHFQITMPYDQNDEQYQLIHVKTNNELSPRIDCGHLADDDRAPSQGGFGNFFRLFRKGASVYVSAPDRFETRKFRTWVSSVSDRDDRLKSPKYVFKLDQPRTLTAVYD